jgi:hypothetical protein
MYNEWKAQRQSAMDSRDWGTQMRDDLYQEQNMNEGYYQGLEARISDRQAAKIPLAGEGAVTFFGYTTTILKLGSKLHPLFIPLAILSRGTEFVAREKSGL